MAGRVRIQSSSVGSAFELRCEIPVDLEDGTGERRDVTLEGGASSGFRSRPIVVLDATTPDGVTVENVTDETLDVVVDTDSDREELTVRLLARGGLERGKHR